MLILLIAYLFIPNNDEQEWSAISILFCTFVLNPKNCCFMLTELKEKIESELPEMIQPIVISIVDKMERARELSPTGVSFVHVANYRNQKGELADHLINIGVNLGKKKEEDIEFLKELDPSDIPEDEIKGFSRVDLETARNELLARLVAPSKQSQARSKGQEEAYLNIAPGVRVHKEHGTLQIFGMKIRKNVKEAGDYGEDTRKPLTKAKDAIRKRMKSTQFRPFNVGQIESRDAISLSGETANTLVLYKWTNFPRP